MEEEEKEGGWVGDLLRCYIRPGDAAQRGGKATGKVEIEKALSPKQHGRCVYREKGGGGWVDESDRRERNRHTFRPEEVQGHAVHEEVGEGLVAEHRREEGVDLPLFYHTKRRDGKIVGHPACHLPVGGLWEGGLVGGWVGEECGSSPCSSTPIAGTSIMNRVICLWALGE